MKKLFLILLLCLFLAGATLRPTRYVSAWATLQPGETRVFAHGLKSQPMIVYVWVRLFVLEAETPADVEDVRPWTELSDHALFLEDVDGQFITVENHGVEAWTIQVVAEP